MAFKLDKQELARREKFEVDLREAAGELEDAVSTYNAAVTELRAPLEAAIEKYNELLEEARGFVEDIASTADGEIDDKSEKWQDGDKGQAAIAWKDAWEQADLEPLSIEFPDELTTTEWPDHADVLDQLPLEAED
jgi:uncharacterized coiled-coil DUF342 family protein